MQRRSWSGGWFGMAVVAVGLLAPTPVAPDRTVPSEEDHCVVEVMWQAADGELRTSAPRCVGSFGEAMALVSGGELRLPEGVTGSVVFDDPAVAGAAASFTLGIHFDGRNGTGSSISVVGSDCSGGWWNTPSWFDDRISSSFNGCYRLRHYDLPNRGGSYADTIGANATHDVAWWMDNRTESVSYLGW